jgi:ketosteroid isomerase-like protein
MIAFRWPVLVVALPMFLAAGCKAPGPAPLSDADRAAMKQTAEQALAMLTSPKPDWEAFISGLYAEDVVIMPAGAASVRGHDAILALIRTLPVFTEYRQVSDRLEGSGNLAWQEWTYYARWGSMTVPDSGRDVFVWRKGPDGTWKVVLEIWNDFTEPTPEPAAAPAQKRRKTTE